MLKQLDFKELESIFRFKLWVDFSWEFSEIGGLICISFPEIDTTSLLPSSLLEGYEMAHFDLSDEYAKESYQFWDPSFLEVDFNLIQQDFI